MPGIMGAPDGREPSGNSPWGGPSEREGRGRKRDDYGVQLFRRALDSFADLAALRHALLELTRSYNPVSNGPILDPATRHRIIQLVEAGQEADARQLLAEHLDVYARRGADREGDRSAPELDVRRQGDGRPC